MRKYLMFASLTTLAACSGGGPQTISALAPTTYTGTVHPGDGTGVVEGTDSGTIPTQDPLQFLNITSAKTFNAVGGLQSYSVDTVHGGVLYQGNASTVNTPSGTINYSPRDGIFTLTLSDTSAGVSQNLRFQDPDHRTTGVAQDGVPNLIGFNYLQSIGSTVDDHFTFFYQRPGNSTTYVSLAGYVRNNVPSTPGTNVFERGAFVFGDKTATSQVPVSGSATYTGGFLATMINNNNSLQWIQGDSNVAIDFGSKAVQLSLNGTVNSATTAGMGAGVAAGTAFVAAGTATINMANTGGFTGSFQTATLGANAIDFTSVAPGTNVAGASSIDGTFYGPNAANVGGGFRIVGGVPNQRVDILGAFTGAKR